MSLRETSSKKYFQSFSSSKKLKEKNKSFETLSNFYKQNLMMNALITRSWTIFFKQGHDTPRPMFKYSQQCVWNARSPASQQSPRPIEFSPSSTPHEDLIKPKTERAACASGDVMTTMSNGAIPLVCLPMVTVSTSLGASVTLCDTEPIFWLATRKSSYRECCSPPLVALLGPALFLKPVCFFFLSLLSSGAFSTSLVLMRMAFS